MDLSEVNFGRTIGDMKQKISIYGGLLLVLLIALPAIAARKPHGLLNEAGCTGGLVVYAGVKDPGSLCELWPDEGYLVQGLSDDAKTVDMIRKYIRSEGLCEGISIAAFDGRHLPYINSVVNLLVVGGDTRPGGMEVARVLAPRGVVLVEGGNKLENMGFPADEISIEGRTWTKYVKPVPDTIDDWTHYLHGADGNAVSRGTALDSPMHAQWVAGPKFTKTHSCLTGVNVMVSAAGRLYSIIDEGPMGLTGFLPSRWTIVARDAFNGVVLWKCPLNSWQPYNNPKRRLVPVDLHRRLVADGDRVYTTLDLFGPVVALGARTGEIELTYTGTAPTEEIIHNNGVLFLVSGTTEGEKVDRRQLADMRLAVEKKRLTACRAKTGEVMWTKEDKDTLGVLPLSLTAAGDRVFYQNTEAVICLDAKSGQEVWRYSRKSNYRRPGWSGPTVVARDGVLLVADRKPVEPGTAIHGAEGEVVALSIETGQKLWSAECAEGDASPVDVFCMQNRVWIGENVRRKESDYARARDIRTGEVVKTQDLSGNWPSQHHHRCYRDKATSEYILAGRTGVEFIDTDSGKLLQQSWIRGNCKFGVLPCNGLLYVPPHQCACYIESKLNGMWALAPRRNLPLPEREAERLCTGPAFGAVERGEASVSGDWPTFRHDAERSGYCPTTVTADVKEIWRTPLSSELTQPMVSGDRLFVASGRDRTVYALDATTGRRLWRFATGGRVDSPPTVAGGLVVFGSADGYVYALRASDGELCWKYLAAPVDRRLVAQGRIASAWPVHGSVLVEKGKVCFAAGRSSYLDGGMYLFKLDLETGKEIVKKKYFSRDPDTGETVQLYKAETGTAYGSDRELPGLLPDILSSDGENIFMRHAVMDRDLEIMDGYKTHLFSSMGFLDDNWWIRTYWLYGKHFFSGCSQWPYAGKQSPGGRMLVFDDRNIYGFTEPSTDKKSRWTEAQPTAGQMFCVAREPDRLSDKEVIEQLPERKRQRLKGNKRGKLLRKSQRYSYAWTGPLSVLPRAMVVTDDFLFTAGPEKFNEKKLADYFYSNRLDRKRTEMPPYVVETLDRFEGRNGAALSVIDRTNGKPVSETKLNSAPVFDGMIAAGRRLYVSMTDGSVVCLGNE